MRISHARLLEMERAKTLRWVLPYYISLERGEPPPLGAHLVFYTRPDRAFSCTVEDVGDLDSEIAYTGPPRTRDKMVELRQLVLGKIPGHPHDK